MHAGTGQHGTHRDVAGAFPPAEAAEHGAGLEGFDEHGGGGKLIDGFGDEGVSQPDAGAGRTAFATPFVTGGEASELGQGDDFTETLIQCGEFTEFVGERREKLALQSVEDRGQVAHDLLTRSRRRLFNHPLKNPNNFEF